MGIWSYRQQVTLSVIISLPHRPHPDIEVDNAAQQLEHHPDTDTDNAAQQPKDAQQPKHTQQPKQAQQPKQPNNLKRREIAATTIATIDDGSYELDGQTYELRPTVDDMIERTMYYPPDSELADWPKAPASEETNSSNFQTDVQIVQCSTLEGCQRLHELLAGLEGDGDKRIGVLNFASAKKPGGGFLTGAQAQVSPLSCTDAAIELIRLACAQEETIARSSTLYASLMIDTAQQFYTVHHSCIKDGYYTHAMIYSPRVQIFRNDAGTWHAPIEVDVLTSPAVNAGDVRRKAKSQWEEGDSEEEKIEIVMKERMGRLLYLFEQQGVRNLILGSFGTGVFRNSVEVVAKLWIELMIAEGSRFKHSFERVLFAIIDAPTVTRFRDVFNASPSEEAPLENEAGTGDANDPEPSNGDESSSAATGKGDPKL
ncbi:hypothetical protein H1R20_g6968, partial [Candolleomyces eurysporus]